MISVIKAEKIILNTAKLLPVKACALPQAYGCVLREDIESDRDQPPFDKALMDGIAIAFAAWRRGAREFNIERVIAAGEPPAVLKNKIHCMQIMTGAVIPKNCDCIIPIEQVSIEGEIVHLKQGPKINPGQFIRRKGADANKGDMLLPQGIRLDPPQVGLAVSAGKMQLKVSAKPKMAIIATGDELVDIGRPIKSHQTRLSNSYALQSLFIQSGLAQADRMHLPDDKNILRSNIRKILKRYDIVVLSGGVSMGEFDYVPQVLADLGVKVLFHKVAQKPGKPFWFGTTKTGKAVFALPGNPASTLICAYRYVIPYLKKAAGMETKKVFVPVKNLPALQPGSTHFLLVKDGAIAASGGSGDFAALARA
ncbi:MAG: molybdopterin molybdotransferase MoeA, partial [Candidatus Omnitrophica bacterium]|nr:molybdopterin molybdotransferase MoeA [Candidatus Omnitrophota bacterium]